MVIGLAFLALTHGLARPSLWVDELFSVQIASAPNVFGVVTGVIEHERRPPLYHWLLHFWIKEVGRSDFALRMLSVLLGLLAVAFVIRLGASMGGQRAGVMAGLLMAASPVFVLYARMVRYYSLVALLAVTGTVLWTRLAAAYEGRSSARQWAVIVAYGLVSLALIYSDYAAVAVLAAQTAFLVLIVRGRAWRILLLALFLFALAYLPWLAVVFRWAPGEIIPADLSASPLGWLLKFAYPFYAFAVGETLFPWNPLAWAVLAVVVAAWVRGWRRLGRLRRFLAALAVAPVAAAAILTSTVAGDLSFVAVPSRALYALPFFLLLISRGFVLPRSPTHPLTFAPALLFTVNLLSLLHLYTGREYLNPIYNLPAREIAAQIGEHLGESDVVIADWDSAVPYYLRREGLGVSLIETPPGDAALDYLTTYSPDRVWLVTLGRDRTRALASPELRAWLESRYPVSLQWGYGEQDETYRAVKEALLGRPSYLYRATITAYHLPPSP